MKKAAWLIGIISISVLMISPISVYAGDINSVEAGVIAYCSQTFHYKGKDYKATESSLSSLRAKLSSDDVDLTPEQGAKAKSMFDANLATGIATGYLVEVSSPTKEETTPSPGSSKEPTTSKKPTASKEPIATKTPTTSDKPDTEKPSETSGDAKQTKNPVIQKEPTSVKDHEAVYQNEGTAVTKEQYQKSEIKVADGEKTIYSAELPIKNAGYNMTTVWAIAIGIFAVLGITIFIACKQIIFAKKHEKS